MVAENPESLMSIVPAVRLSPPSTPSPSKVCRMTLVSASGLFLMLTSPTTRAEPAEVIAAAYAASTLSSVSGLPAFGAACEIDGDGACRDGWTGAVISMSLP